MGKIAVALLIASGCMLFGCSDVLGDNYNVVIDPNFPDEYKTAIVDGVQAWEEMLGPDLNIMSIKVAKCQAGLIPTIGSEPPGELEMPQPGVRREICFHPVSASWIDRQETNEGGVIGLTFRHATEDSADVFIPTDRDSLLTETAARPHLHIQTAAHEFGHAIGLEHTQEHTLMYWNWGGAQSPLPTCDDVSQYLSIRHLSSVTSQCPNGGYWHYYH